MMRLNWWTTIVLLLISQVNAVDHAKPQESELKADAKDLLKAAATSAEYSSSLASDYSTSEKQSQGHDNVASSSSVSASVDSGNYNQVEAQSQYSQPLSYSQPGTPVQPIHSYSQPLNYAPQALPYTSESQLSQQYGSPSDSQSSNNGVQSQYPSIKDLPNPEIPAASASSSYYPQYPAHQAYNPQLVLQQQASAPISDYHSVSQQAPQEQQYDSNQATYVQPAQNQQVYLHHQHHVTIPGSAYSEQSYVVENDKNGAYPQVNNYPQANSYSQPLPPEYSQEYSSQGNQHVQPQISVKPKKTVILAIPVKLVAKNKYSGQNNGGYQSPQEVQPHYSTNVVPAAANLPVTHSNSIEKNNYYSNEGEKPSFQEKPLYQDKPSYADKVEEYPKVNHNVNNLQNGGYNGGYEPENGDHYNSPRYNAGPHKTIYSSARDVKPLSNYQSNRPRRPSNYGPGPEIYAQSHGPEYTTNNGPGIEDEISLSPNPDHGGGNGYPVGEIEHNHIHALPAIHHHKHKVSEIYESPVEHLPPPYIPSDFPSLSGPSLGASLHGLGNLGNPMDLIYSSPYKFPGLPSSKPSGGYGGLRSPLMGAASSQSPASTSSASNYGQFLSSLLSAYSLGSLKPSASKPSSSQKGGLASYLNLPGLDLFKGYGSSLSPSYSSLLPSASGLNKYYLPNPAKPANKPSYSYLGWPSELTQPAKPSGGLLASSSNIVSSIDELFKSSLNPTSKKRPLYSDATRAITNLYKKFLN